MEHRQEMPPCDSIPSTEIHTNLTLIAKLTKTHKKNTLNF